MTLFRKTVLQLLHGRLEPLEIRLGKTPEGLSRLLDEVSRAQDKEDILFAVTDCLQARGWNPAKYEDVLAGLTWADPIRSERTEPVDLVGARIRSGDRSLRVGWTHSPGLSAPGPNGEPEGLAVEKTLRVLQHLGLQACWMELPYSKLISAVLEYQVDAILPILMRFPFRERQVLFSHPVFDRAPVVCVANQEATRQIFGDHYPAAEEMIIVSLLGEIGSHLSERLFPGAECEEACESLESAIETIRSTPIRAGAQPKLRVMSADFRMCTALADRYHDLQVLPHPAPPMSETSFVVHPRESVLLNAINGSLELITRIDTRNNGTSVMEARRTRAKAERTEGRSGKGMERGKHASV